jgi:hypothetical protein
MPSLLPTFQSTLATVWAAVVPSDQESPATPDPLLRYRVIYTLDEERRNGGHREILWGRAQMLGNQARGIRLIEWSIEAYLFLHRRDRPDLEFGQALNNEIQDLHSAYWARIPSGWGNVAIRHAVLDQVSTETNTGTPRARAGGARLTSTVARVTFPFRVLIQEE